MSWIQVPIALLATAAASSARAKDHPVQSAGTENGNEVHQCSPLEEVLRYFGAKPIRVVVRERDGSDPDTVECCKES